MASPARPANVVRQGPARRSRKALAALAGVLALISLVFLLRDEAQYWILRYRASEGSGPRRVQALADLADLHDPRAWDLLLDEASSDSVHLQAIDRRQDPARLAALIIERLRSGEVFDRGNGLYAAYWFRELPGIKDSAEVRQLLLEAAEDDEPRLRRYALLLLTALGEPRAVGCCLSALRDADLQVRMLAAEGLGRLRDPAAGVSAAIEAALLQALADEATQVRAAAAVALAALGSQRAVPALIGMVYGRGEQGDTPAWVRREDAAEALGRFKGPQVEAALIDALDQGHEPLAVKALRALLGLSSPAARAALLKAVEHPQDLVRYECIELLGRSKLDAAAGPLIARLRRSRGRTETDIISDALIEITGQPWGVSKDDPPAVEAAGIERWEQWLKDQQAQGKGAGDGG